jgi:hypothetical protein
MNKCNGGATAPVIFMNHAILDIGIESSYWPINCLIRVVH